MGLADGMFKIVFRCENDLSGLVVHYNKPWIYLGGINMAQFDFY